MGVVYKATDRHLRRTVAVKILSPDLYADKLVRTRFEREASSAAALEHPHIVRVYAIDLDPESRQPYIVMEYVPGANLATMLREGELGHERSLSIFDQIASALEAVHQVGLVHRDVKPENVLIRKPGAGALHAMLSDFGIAKAIDSQTSLTLGAIGTPGYMSPDVAGLERATARSDQYALAAVLFEMLGGVRLFAGMEVPKAHREEPLPDLTVALPTANRALRAAVSRALAKEPKDRFPSVAAFAEAVCESQQGPTVARPPLQLLMEEVIAKSCPCLPAEIAGAVNAMLPPDDVGVTPLQVEGRARLYSQLFERRPDGRIGLRNH